MKENSPHSCCSQKNISKNAKKEKWPFWKFVAFLLLPTGVLTIIFPLYAGPAPFGYDGLSGNWYSILTCVALTGIIVKIILLHTAQGQQEDHVHKRSKQAHLDCLEQWKKQHHTEQREIFYLQRRNIMVGHMQIRKNSLTLLTCFPYQYVSVHKIAAIHDFVDQFYFLSTICMRLSTEYRTTAIASILDKISHEMYHQFKHEYKKHHVKKRLPSIRSTYKHYQFCSLQGIAIILQNLEKISDWLVQADSWIKHMATIEHSPEYYEQLILDKLTKHEAICLYISRLYLECQNKEMDWNNCQRYLNQLQNLYQNKRWLTEHEMLLRLLRLRHPTLEDIDDSMSIIIFKNNYLKKNNIDHAEQEFDQDDTAQDSNNNNIHTSHPI